MVHTALHHVSSHIGSDPVKIYRAPDSDLYRPALIGRVETVPWRPIATKNVVGSVNRVVMYAAGKAHIAGTTKAVRGNQTAIQAKLRLYASHTGQMLSETESDSSGAYRFDNLNPDIRYTILGHDRNGRFNALVVDDLEATL